MTDTLTAPTSVEQFAFGRLSDVSETCRWHLADLKWDEMLPDPPQELIDVVHATALAEITTYDATAQFMACFPDDADFTQWVSIWFFEETRHPAMLVEWLRRTGRPLLESEILEARETEPFVKWGLGMLAINVVAETVASMGYQLLAEISPDPVVAQISRNLARDEARHAASFFFFASRWLERSARPERDHRRVLVLLKLFATRRDQFGHPGLTTSNTTLGAEVAGQESSEDHQQALEHRLMTTFSALVGLELGRFTQFTDLDDMIKAVQR